MGDVKRYEACKLAGTWVCGDATDGSSFVMGDGESAHRLTDFLNTKDSELAKAQARIAELETESARACTTALRKTSELLTLQDKQGELANSWDAAWAEMYETGDEKIDVVSRNRAAAKRECATELREKMK